MVELFSVTCILGWSNHDTGPVSLRLYALDQGPHPRWDKPFARVVEKPLIERGQASEGCRAVVLLVGDRFVSDEVLERCRLAAEQGVRDVLAEFLG